MPEIHSNQQHEVLLATGESVRIRFVPPGRSRSAGVVLPGTLAGLLLMSVWLGGCGNKGDLFLPSDVIAAEELEDAAEKLKKRKNTASE